MTIYNKFLINTLKILFYLFPLSFLFGNLIINLFVFLIIIFGILYYKNDLLKWNDNFLFICLTFFFLFLLFTTYYNYYFFETSKDAIKSVLYSRYLFFLIVIKQLIFKSDIKINYFLNLCYILTCLISLDIFIQFSIGKNILGYSPVVINENIIYYSGIFGEELIAGGFILTFSIIGIFSIFNLFKIENKFLLAIIFAISSVFFLLAIVLTGNRMPVIMYIVFIITLSLIYKKKEKIYFSITSIFILFILIISVISNEDLKNRYENLKKGIPSPVILFKEIQKDYPTFEKYKYSGEKFHNLEEFRQTKLMNDLDENSTVIILKDSKIFPRKGKNFIQIGYEEISYTDIKGNKLLNVKRGERNSKPSSHSKNASITSSTHFKLLSFYTGHLPIFITSLDLFLDKPFLGGGIKSFRNNCNKKEYLPNRQCENHPHNFILDILNDTGLLGLIIIISIAFYITYNNYIDYRAGEKKKSKISNWVYLAIILTIFIHLFPFKSTGSFFSTFNSSFFFMVLGISYGLHELRYNK